MKSLSRLALALTVTGIFLSASRPAVATEVGRSRSFGLGFQAGEPTGLVGKIFANPREALDFGIGWYSWGWGNCHGGFCDRFGSMSVNVDYLWQDNILDYRNITFDWHIGAGGRVWFLYNNDGSNGSDRVALAGRMPLGLDLMFDRPNFLEVFAELTPSLYVLPVATFDVEGGIGVRFYF